ncbi:hypothetical protein [Catenovulum agarivorans]|uniref:hypothetical protein n=1 Tax=Catenovulum agarivorans TaxID=1172192 RepID=UPI0012FC9B85|nr:hypothetical protein [Catenovulum agarivorans]
MMNDLHNSDEQKLKKLYQQSKQQLPNDELLTQRILQATDKEVRKRPMQKQWLAIAAAVLVAVLTVDMIQWSQNLNSSPTSDYSSSVVQLTPINDLPADQVVIAKEIAQLEAFIQSATAESLTLSEGFNQHLFAYQSQYMQKPNSIVYAVAAQIRVSGEQLVIHFCDKETKVQKFYANKLDRQEQQQFLAKLQQAQMVTVYLSTDGKVTAISPNQQQQCS